MRLLIVTQVVDKNEPLLGFFHTWLTAFAAQFESIVVICLSEGAHDLPDNVRVFSLGKEFVIARSDQTERRVPCEADAKQGSNPGDVPYIHTHTYTNSPYLLKRLRYVTRFLYLIFKYRRSYDTVYVHMNQEYVLLGGLLWRLWGKRVTMWRNHYAGSWRTDLAARLCHKVFCTSRHSYTAKYDKTVFMPVGVPDDLFSAEGTEGRVPRSILSFGRISPSKKLDLFLDALGTLHKDGVAFTATICGDTLPQYQSYADSLRAKAHDLGIADRITWKPGIPYHEASALYRTHDVFVNQSPSGMFDKTLFEAMLSGTLVVTSSKDLAHTLDPRAHFKEGDATDLARALSVCLTFTSAERTSLTAAQTELAQKHTLTALAVRLQKELSAS